MKLGYRIAACAVGLLSVLGMLYAAKKPFRQYPGVEYFRFEVPPDYQEITEWTRARLRYPSFLNVHGIGEPPSAGYRRWNCPGNGYRRDHTRIVSGYQDVPAGEYEEFTRGCYGAHFAPGVWTSYGEAWRAPAGRVHWAGAECAPEWNGYMEGAVRSGEATAEMVAAL